MIKRDLIVAVLLTFCLSVILFRILPISSQGPGDYDPWYDINDDGKIDMRDIGGVCRKFGTFGTPIDKVAVAYDSGWRDLYHYRGGFYTIGHNLGTSNITVDIVSDAQGTVFGVHQCNLGGSEYTPGFLQWFYSSDDWYVGSMIETSDGGYAIAGETAAGADYGTDGFLAKYDLTGTLEWIRYYFEPGLHDHVSSVVQTSDGGYALAGDTGGAGYKYQGWLVKTDHNGIKLWSNKYGGADHDWFTSVVQTSDGGYALGGSTEVPAPDRNFYLVKTDASGTELWSNDYGGPDRDMANSMIQTSDGGYALAGHTDSFGLNGDFYLVKTYANGVQDWGGAWGGTGYDQANCVIESNDPFPSGFVMAGKTNSYGVNGDIWLVKCDPSGTTEWKENYGGDYEDEAYSVVQTSDRGYALAGYTESFGAGGRDAWLVKTHQDGTSLWNLTWGLATTDEYAYAVVQTSDGGYAIGGELSTAGVFNILLVKWDVWKYGVVWTNTTDDTITLYRGTEDDDWRLVRVRIMKTRETP